MHKQIDCHFIREKLMVKEISTQFINSKNQLADHLMKSLIQCYRYRITENIDNPKILYKVNGNHNGL